ncbi:MAG: hypothetical protein WC382_04455 [Methanoregulaceae archaeon]|jgi:hypothetical protein
MHVVISMNLQWKIIFSTCLAIAICFAVASAATETPFTKNSFDKPSTTSFAEAKAAAAANFRTDWTSFDREPPDAGGPADPIPPEITRPTAIPTRVPTPQMTLPAFQRPAISRWEAEAIALEGFSNLDPRTTTVFITLQLHRDTSKLIWVIDIRGSTKCDEPPEGYVCLRTPICVMISVDAMTGEKSRYL